MVTDGAADRSLTWLARSGVLARIFHATMYDAILTLLPAYGLWRSFFDSNKEIAMSKIMTKGEILVEIMATKIGQSFRLPGQQVGPYPSGAPPIFIDQV